MLDILRYPDSRLHQTSLPVREDEFGPELVAIMNAMVATMTAARGIGLAGVQVGDMRRIAVVTVGGKPVSMVNPVVDHVSRIRHADVEGCLSFPGQARKVSRPRQVTVTFRTPSGETRTLDLAGMEARCALHEIDHLNGKTIL